MPDRGPVEPLVRLAGAKRLDGRSEAAWRDEQLAEVEAHFEARRSGATEEARRRWAVRRARPGGEARWRAAERRRLRAALGLGGRTGAPLHRVLRRRRLASDSGSAVERWRVHDASGIVASALVVAGPRPAATVIVVDGPGTVPSSSAQRPWIEALVGQGVAVVLLTRVDRSADDAICRRAAGKDRRHVLHRLGFGVGRTPEGLEVDAVGALSAAARRAFRTAGSGRHQVSVLGLGDGSRAAALAAAALDLDGLCLIEDGRLPEVDRPGGPIDERLLGSASLPGGARLADLIGRSRMRLGVSTPSAAAAALARSPTQAASAALDLPPATWRAADAASLFRAWERRLRDDIARVEGMRRERLTVAVPEPERPQATQMRRRAQRAMVGERPTRGQRRGPRLAARLLKVTDAFVAHEVSLDLGAGLTVWGHLLRPRGQAAPGPAVICQHGLDGVPGDVSGLTDRPDDAYHAFGARLAERGYTVFAPYLSVPVPQAERLDRAVAAALSVGAMRTEVELARLRAVVRFLGSLELVDPARIGYYGLSYGGYTGLWLGGLEPRLAATVVSGHFNDWTAKLTDDRDDASFLRHPDEDFTTWRVLCGATHPELIAAMWPRPVLIEWADRDATTKAPWHEAAWAEVEQWAERWGVEDRVERATFHGIHEVGGGDSFAFLDRWLRPEQASGRDYVYGLRGVGRDLDGISDHRPDTLPYLTRVIDAEHPLADVVWLGGEDPWFRGVGVRLSRVGEPGDLEVRVGTMAGAADVATLRLAAAVVHPVWDLWYDLEGEPVRLEPGRRYHLTIGCRPGPGPADGYVAYGPRQSGGSLHADEFRIAYRLLGAGHPVDDGAEPTHEFGRRLLDPPRRPSLAAIPSEAAPDEVRLDGAWRLVLAGDPDPLASRAASTLHDGLQQLFGWQPAGRGPAAPTIRLTLAATDSMHPSSARDERVERRVADGGIDIIAPTARGLLRGVRRLLDDMLERGAPILRLGTTEQRATFSPRLTTPALPAGVRYSEISHPSVYTDGLLEADRRRRVRRGVDVGEPRGGRP